MTWENQKGQKSERTDESIPQILWDSINSNFQGIETFTSGHLLFQR